MNHLLALLRDRSTPTWLRILGVQIGVGTVTGLLLSLNLQSPGLILDALTALFQLILTSLLIGALLWFTLQKFESRAHTLRDLYWRVILIHVPFLTGKVVTAWTDLPFDILGVFVSLFFTLYVMTERYGINKRRATSLMSKVALIVLGIWGAYLIHQWQSEYAFMKRAEPESARQIHLENE